MIKDNERQGTTSPWMQDVPPQSYPAAPTLIQADVCIIGAGIAGITAAYCLMKAGKSVIVVDAKSVGSGETQRSTAHLSYVLDKRYTELESLHGRDHAQVALQSHAQAIDMIEQIVQSEEIDCEFSRVDGYLYLAAHTDKEIMAQELAFFHQAGFTNVEKIKTPDYPVMGREGLRFPDQAQFHPLKYVTSLAKILHQKGVKIFTDTKITEIEGGISPCATSEKGQVFKCDSMIVATHTPINNRFTIHTKQAAYRTYVIGLRVAADFSVPALLWDTADPYHFVRCRSDILLVGGEDHKTGQRTDPQTCFQNLKLWASQVFPNTGPPMFEWSGQILEPVDSLAFIGRNPSDKNVFIATGFSGNGMTYGTVAGRLLSDLILRRPSPWEKVYDPSRIPFKAAKTFITENVNVATQYSDWMTPGDVPSGDVISRGSGAVIREGLQKFSVYKDDYGLVHKKTATCPHLGGIVHWNDAEESWDCPCHGSRFDKMGKVLSGPAISDLKVKV